MVTWPGGVGCPNCASNQIPLKGGGKRKTRKAKKSRKASRKGKKMTRRRR